MDDDEPVITCVLAVATFADGVAIDCPYKKPKTRTRAALKYATRHPQYDYETRTQETQHRFHSDKASAERLDLSWGPFGRPHDTKEIDLNIDIPEQAAQVPAALKKLHASCERRARALENWDGNGDGPTFVPVVLRSQDSFIRHFCNGGTVQCVPAQEMEIEMSKAEFDELVSSYGRFIERPKEPSRLARLFGAKAASAPRIGNLQLKF